MHGAQRVGLAFCNIGNAQRERATDSGHGRCVDWGARASANIRALVFDIERMHQRSSGAVVGVNAAVAFGGYQAAIAVHDGELKCVDAIAARGPDVGDLSPVNVRLRESEVHRQILPRKVCAGQVSTNGGVDQCVGDYWRINIQCLEQTASDGQY